MHIITRARLREFWEKHPDAEAPLAAWYRIMSRARYIKPTDLRRDLPSASFIGDEMVVVNIGGGKYRLVTAVVYATAMVYIKRVGTHAEIRPLGVVIQREGNRTGAVKASGARVESTSMASVSRLDFSKPHVLRTPDEYAAAVGEIDALLAEGVPKAGSEDADRLQLLSVLVEAYENDHEPPTPDVGPVELVRFMLEQREMTRADLAPLMGGKARVSEFFSGRRSLSIAQVRRLSEALRIPADLLIVREAAGPRGRKAATKGRSAAGRRTAVAEPSPAKPKPAKRSRGRR